MRRGKVRRIVVILREHVGDIVNSTPYLRALQAAYPEATFAVDVGVGAGGVLEHFPRIDELWLRPTHEGLGGKASYVRRLRRGRFDMAVILDDSSRFVLETWMAGIPLRAGVFRKRFKSLFTTQVPYSRERHDVFDPFNDLMRSLSVPIPNPKPILFPNDDDEHRVVELMRAHGLDPSVLVALNASTGRAYNRWPADRWSRVADFLKEKGFACVLLGAAQDSAFNEQIVAGSQSKPLDLAGTLSLVQLYELLKRVKYFVSIDTGTVHIAAAAEAPSVILYGPTDPKRFYPYGNRWIAVRAEDAVMASNTVLAVQEAIEDLLRRFP